jgi:dihydrofolate reductase
MKISIIVAIAENNVIGNKNALPWHLPADLKHFKKITTGHTVIMGQNTYESIGKPLPQRKNIVLSFDKRYRAPGCIVVHSVEESIRAASTEKEKEVFIIGGASIYKQTIGIADKLYITKVHHKFAGDVFFPEIDMSKWKTISSEKHKSDELNPYDYEFCVFLKRKI